MFLWLHSVSGLRRRRFLFPAPPDGSLRQEETGGGKETGSRKKTEEELLETIKKDPDLAVLKPYAWIFALTLAFSMANTVLGSLTPQVVRGGGLHPRRRTAAGGRDGSCARVDDAGRTADAAAVCRGFSAHCRGALGAVHLRQPHGHGKGLGKLCQIAARRAVPPYPAAAVRVACRAQHG